MRNKFYGKGEGGTNEIRSKYRQYYINKFYNLFMNSYRINGIDYRAINYLLKKMWADGTTYSFVAKGTRKTIEIDGEESQGQLIFCPYAPISYDWSDAVIECTLVNTRGVSFIPSSPQKVDVDGVIGYAQRNRKSVREIVEVIVDKIVDVDMTIRAQLFAMKFPFLVKVSSENEMKMKNLFDKIANDELVAFVGLDDDAPLPLNTGINYTLDKLYQLKTQYENEILTYLGVDNGGGVEKKEHLIVDEINANNEEINTSGDCFLDSMKEFFSRIEQVCQYTITIEANSRPSQSIREEDDREEEGEEDE